MTKPQNFVVLGLALVVLMASRAADAADAKTYHGSVCVPAGSDWNVFDYGYLGMYSSDSSCLPTQRYVACPIPRDLTNDASGLDYLKLEVKNTFISGCSNNTLWCNLYAMNEDSSTGEYLDYEYAQTLTTGEQQLTFSDLGTNLTTSAGGEGSYMLWCAIGGLDIIRQFTVRELYGSD